MDLLTRLSLRARNRLPAVKPVTASRFGPYEPAPAATPDTPAPLQLAEEAEAGPAISRPDAGTTGAYGPPLEAVIRAERSRAAAQQAPAGRSGPGSEFPAADPPSVKTVPRDALHTAAVPRSSGGPQAGSRTAHPFFSRQPRGVTALPAQKNRKRLPESSTVPDITASHSPEAEQPPDQPRVASRAVPPNAPNGVPSRHADAGEIPVRFERPNPPPTAGRNLTLPSGPEHGAAADTAAVPQHPEDAMALPATGDRRLPLKSTEQVIQVSIGRIDVRAVAAPAAPASRRVPKTGILTLDQYLKKRGS